MNGYVDFEIEAASRRPHHARSSRRDVGKNFSFERNSGVDFIGPAFRLLEDRL